MYLPCVLPMYLTAKDNNKLNSFCIDIVGKMNNKSYKKLIEQEYNINFIYPVNVIKYNSIYKCSNEFEKLCYLIYLQRKNGLSKDAINHNIKLDSVEQEAYTLFLTNDYNNVNQLVYSNEVNIRLATLLGLFYEIDNTHFSDLFYWLEHFNTFVCLTIRDFYKYEESEISYWNLDKFIPLRNLKTTIYLEYIDDCNSYKEFLKYKGGILNV